MVHEHEDRRGGGDGSRPPEGRAAHPDAEQDAVRHSAEIPRGQGDSPPRQEVDERIDHQPLIDAAQAHPDKESQDGEAAAKGCECYAQRADPKVESRVTSISWGWRHCQCAKPSDVLAPGSALGPI